MAFSRKDLEGDDAQFRVDEGFGAAPAKEDKTPPAESAEVTIDTEDDADPSSDATDTPPDDQVDGTSDDETEESSTSNAAPGSETETNDEQTDGNTEKPAPKKGSAAARIQELVDERDGYKAYGGYAQETIATLNAQISELRKKVPEPKPTTTVSTDPMPTMEDADVNYDPQAFEAKVKAWTDRTVERRVKAKAAPAATTAEALAENFNKRATEFVKDHPDFPANTALLPTFAPRTAKVLVTGEDGVPLLHWLGKHKAEAVRIAKLPEEDQLVELGSIRHVIKGATKVIPPTENTETQDAPKSPAKPKSTSNAPPPPRRVAAGGRSQSRDIQDPGMGMEEFARRHREEKNASREASRKQRMGR